jgi:hypothetical protein
MLNYTRCITALMHDIVRRVPALAFIDMDELLVFARYGRSGAEGAHATCHCFNLPPSEPGYYFWRDRATGKLTRRSEWFVTKSPEVWIGPKRVEYLISFAIPRFCDQGLERTRKQMHYPEAPAWTAKLDTVVHELYHVDPRHSGIRRVERADGTDSTQSHGMAFYSRVAEMVNEYLASGPDPSVYEFLKYDFAGLTARYGGVLATTFRTFPSFPKRYIEVLEDQPSCGERIRIEPLKLPQLPTRYTEADLHVRQFMAVPAGRCGRKQRIQCPSVRFAQDTPAMVEAASEQAAASTQPIEPEAILPYGTCGRLAPKYRSFQ